MEARRVQEQAEKDVQRHSAPQHVKLTAAVQELLRCAVCKDKCVLEGERFRCVNAECRAVFPITNGIPVFINENSSIFSIDGFLQQRETFFIRESKFRKTVKRLVPKLDRNLKSKHNCEKFGRLLLARASAPRVLVIGGSVLGEGTKALLSSYSDIELVECDVSLGPRTALICDAHDIPFGDDTFDGVIAQAVLEHVADPWRCVENIHRVLKKDGLVYAETPFMQQVHGGPYDFTRFTHLGHRRLFRKFKEIESGATTGPALALAWSLQYFLLSFTTIDILRNSIKVCARFVSYFLTFFDYYLIDRPGVFDAASGYYFTGQKSDESLSDRELIKLYRGVR